MTANNPISWASFVIWAEYAHNTLHSSAISMSPFECQFGSHCSLTKRQRLGFNALRFVRCWRLNWRKARLKLLQASQQYQRQATHHLWTAPALFPGQWVWLSTKNLPACGVPQADSTFHQSFPYFKESNPVTNRLFLSTSLKMNPTFHVSLLKPAVSSPFQSDLPLLLGSLGASLLTRSIGYWTLVMYGDPWPWIGGPVRVVDLFLATRGPLCLFVGFQSLSLCLIIVTCALFLAVYLRHPSPEYFAPCFPCHAHAQV